MFIYTLKYYLQKIGVSTFLKTTLFCYVNKPNVEYYMITISNISTIPTSLFGTKFELCFFENFEKFMDLGRRSSAKRQKVSENILLDDDNDVILSTSENSNEVIQIESLFTLKA